MIAAPDIRDLFRTALLALTASLLAACAVPGFEAGGSRFATPDTPAWAVDAAATDYTLIPIGPDQLRPAGDPAALAVRTGPDLSGYEYRIGAQDVLAITVWDHPELTIPAGEFRSAEAAGHLVGTDGSIYYPYIGDVPVAGKTVREVRSTLTQRLAQFVTDPQLDVRVAAFRSQRVYVAGEVATPGIVPVTDVPLTLVDALQMVGGETDEADLGRVSIARGDTLERVNLRALLDNGDLSQNRVLMHGDVVHVPDRRDNRVFVLGQVGEPGAYVMHRGRMDLAEALGLARNLDEATADAERVFVIRGDYTNPDIYWLDAQSPDAMLLASRFPLNPNDVVYVAPVSLERWNRVIRQILPTVQAVFQTTVAADRVND